ncbi:MAG: TIGR04002 family protein [Acutalibacteraceae bacterium]
MNRSVSKTVRHLTVTALFAAIITLTTAYLFHIPIGVSGYIHLGDAFIYLAAAFLPMPYAMAAAAVGAGLADILSGAPEWAIFTVIIKALMAMCFTYKSEKVINVHNIIGSVAAGVINIVGYYFAEVILYGNWITPLLAIPTGGLVQSGGGMLVFILVGVLLDQAHIKNRLQKMA